MQLMGLMGIGDLQSTTPSRLEVDYPIGNQNEDAEVIRTGTASGSEELRPPRAKTTASDGIKSCQGR